MRSQNNCPLQGLTTFGTPATARRVVWLDSADDALQWLNERRADEPMAVLGGGSNVLFIRDFDGTVAIEADRSASADGLTLGAGWTLDDVVRRRAAEGRHGMENLAAIPGTLGGAVVQNAGAYGVETGDAVEWVEAIDMQSLRTERLSRGDCRFGYRTSVFKQQAGRWLITAVRLLEGGDYSPVLTHQALQSLPHLTAQQMIDSVTALRWRKLPRPEEHGSAGSFFKNPVVGSEAAGALLRRYPEMPVYAGGKLSAAWLIDHAGWRGKTLGKAGVWPGQALVLYNTGGCEGAEVVALAQAVSDDVRRMFGVELETEAIII
ncbi:MAG: UDP-N-acetylmuramate dehydrogenase [Bacteroidales bacterium]|nr:UDP-N-acetylmuramate dehydrogenase [Bacteroidales bacterium]